MYSNVRPRQDLAGIARALENVNYLLFKRGEGVDGVRPG